MSLLDYLIPLQSIASSLKRLVEIEEQRMKLEHILSGYSIESVKEASFGAEEEPTKTQKDATFSIYNHLNTPGPALLQQTEEELARLAEIYDLYTKHYGHHQGIENISIGDMISKLKHSGFVEPEPTPQDQ